MINKITKIRALIFEATNVCVEERMKLNTSTMKKRELKSKEQGLLDAIKILDSVI